MNGSPEPHGLTFTAIDFETACADRASACAVGLARVRDGQVVERFSTLIRPPTGLDSFQDRNIQIHGITPGMVADAPEWDAVFETVATFVGADTLVAHNAPFDRSVLQRASSWYDLDWPPNPWLDTIAISRRMLTLASYSLPFVAVALDLPELEHHVAVADAEQAALIAIALTERAGARSLDGLLTHVGSLASDRRAQRREPGDFSSLATDEPLAGELVAFTGKLITTTRNEAVALVNHLGGVGQASVTATTTILVTGDFDPQSLKPGAAMTGKLAKAQKMAEAGKPIEIMTEQGFLERIDVSREAIEAATRAQRAESRTGWLPQYVIDQARSLQGKHLAHNAWIRAALKHPDGKARPEDECVRCGDLIGSDGFWLFAERHVCSSDCAEALKSAAKRAWTRGNISRPAAPAYEESWGRRD